MLIERLIEIMPPIRRFRLRQILEREVLESPEGLRKLWVDTEEPLQIFLGKREEFEDYLFELVGTLEGVRKTHKILKVTLDNLPEVARKYLPKETKVIK